MTESQSAKAKFVHIVSPMAPSQTMPFYGAFVPVISESLRRNGWIVNEDGVVKARSWSMFGKARRHAALAWKLLKLSAKRPSVLYVHSPAWFSLLVLALFRYNRTLVVNIHGSEIHGRTFAANLFWPATRKCIREADLVISPSTAFISKIVTATNVNPARCFASPSGGYQKDKFFYVPKNDDVPRIGYVSRIVQKKGWRTFLAIYDSVKTNHPTLEAIIIGDGSERLLLENELAQRADANIRYLGPQPQASLQAHYASMSAFVFTSEISGVDTLGLVSIEAQACGTPVIATDAAITREYVTPGENGFLASSGDVEGFAALIDQVLGWPEEKRRRIAVGASAFENARVGAELSAAIHRAISGHED